MYLMYLASPVHPQNSKDMLRCLYLLLFLWFVFLSTNENEEELYSKFKGETNSSPSS